MDNSLVRAHDISLRVSRLDLKQYALLAFVLDINGARVLAVRVARLAEDHVDRVDDYELAPVLGCCSVHSDY